MKYLITEYKLKVLSKIGARLNEANITWVIGASLLLYFKGITQEFNDIDIMVTENDVFRLKEILLFLETDWLVGRSIDLCVKYY